LENNLIEHGAGHVIYKYAQKEQLDIREAGLKLLETHNLDSIKGVFKHD
jgi:D-ornithine 4,5-aminomutase subunit alpha